MARLIATLIAAVLFAPAPVRPVVASAAQAYDLGQTTVEQPQFEAGSRFASMPVALQGLMAVPDGPGPFPVALLVAWLVSVLYGTVGRGRRGPLSLPCR